MDVRIPREKTGRTFEAFPDPWRSILDACDWADGPVAAEQLLRRRRRRGRRRCPDDADDDDKDLPFLCSRSLVVEDGVSGGARRSSYSMSDRRRGVTWLKAALHSLSHPKADFRRLVEFLGEPVPVTRSVGVVDRGRSLGTRLVHVPRILGLPPPLRRRLVPFLSLVSSLLFHGPEAGRDSLRSLAEKLAISRYDDRRDDNVDDVSLQRWTCVLFDVHPVESGSSSNNSSSSPSLFFRSQRHKDQIQALQNRLARRKDVAFSKNGDEGKTVVESASLTAGIGRDPILATGEGDSEEPPSTGPIHRVPASPPPPSYSPFFADLENEDPLRSSLEFDAMEANVGGSNEEWDAERVKAAVEALTNWTEWHRRRRESGGGRGRGGAAGAKGSGGGDVSSVLSSTQTGARAAAADDESLDAEIFVDLNPSEMLRALRLWHDGIDGAGDDDDSNGGVDEARPRPTRDSPGGRGGILGESGLQRLLSTVVAWRKSSPVDNSETADAFHRAGVTSGISEATSGVFDFVSSNVLIPHLTRLSSSPSRATVHVVGEFIDAHSSIAAVKFFLPYVDRLRNQVQDESRFSIVSSLFGNVVRLHLPYHGADALLRGVIERRREDTLIGNSLLFIVVEAVIDRCSTPSDSSSFSPRCLQALVVRFCADLRSHPRDKSLVLLLSKFLRCMQTRGGGAAGAVTTLAEEDARELNAAMQLNRTPLKKGVVNLLKLYLG